VIPGRGLRATKCAEPVERGAGPRAGFPPLPAVRSRTSTRARLQLPLVGTPRTVSWQRRRARPPALLQNGPCDARTPASRR
jgi:hypothetical protein